MDDNYIEEEFQIKNVKGIRLKDENGVYWYPFTDFIKYFLFTNSTSNLIAKYRDDEEFREKHMKVVEFKPRGAKNPYYKTKTWFFDTEGMRQALENKKMNFNKEDSNRIRRAKSEYLAACQNFFGIQSNEPEYFIGYTPDISKYNVWAILCIRHDTKIKRDDIWKKCPTCQFYYPANNRYFKGALSIDKECKQCTGEDFKCANKKIQYIYDTGGYDLLCSLLLKEKDRIVKDLMDWTGW